MLRFRHHKNPRESKNGILLERDRRITWNSFQGWYWVNATVLNIIGVQWTSRWLWQRRFFLFELHWQHRCRCRSTYRYHFTRNEISALRSVVWDFGGVSCIKTYDGHEFMRYYINIPEKITGWLFKDRKPLVRNDPPNNLWSAMGKWITVLVSFDSEPNLSDSTPPPYDVVG